MSSPQQTRVPPPATVTTTSLPQMLHLYFSPTFSTGMTYSAPCCTRHTLVTTVAREMTWERDILWMLCLCWHPNLSRSARDVNGQWV